MDNKNFKKGSNKNFLRLFHQDGIIDLVSSALLINFGFDMINNSEFTSLFTWVPIILFNSTKQNFTLARLGAEAFGGDKRAIRMWTFIPAAIMIAVIVLLSTLMLQDVFALDEQTLFSISGNAQNLAGGLLTALILLIPAAWIPLKRFYIYCFVALFSGIISYFVLPACTPFFVTGAVMAVIGSRLAIRFSRAYPAKKDNKEDES